MKRSWRQHAGRALPLLLAVVGLLTAAVALGAPDAGGSMFEISWFTIDGGGATSSGAALELRGTMGQPDAGALSGGAFVLDGGFWGSGGPTLCAGDINGDGAVDVDDLIEVILAWGSEDPDADTNDDGIVNVDDLVTVILEWGAC